MFKILFKVFLSFLFVLAFDAHSSDLPEPDAFNQIVGVQAFDAAYKFTDDNVVLEQAKRIREMGARMIKTKVVNFEDDTNFHEILDMGFDTFFFWWRSDSASWANGFISLEDPKYKETDEYKETFKFACYLLERNRNAPCKFFIGHWEGDWYLLDNYDTSKNPDPKRIEGMINWLNVRQKAVEDARRFVGEWTRSEVYHYTEVNLVRDAMLHGKDRLVNKVLPLSYVDFVSYSSYDVQEESPETIMETVNYIEQQLRPRNEIKGRRVFIGEFGVPYNGEKIRKTAEMDQISLEAAHKKVNCDILVRFLGSGVPFIFYWQMYNNEIGADGRQNGFWLINDKGEKQALYFALEQLYRHQASVKVVKNVRDETIRKLQSQ